MRGCVARETAWSLDEIRQLPQVEQSVDVHCVTRWSRPAMTFRGVPLRDLLDVAAPTEDAVFVSFIARSERNHSTSLPLDYLAGCSALVAMEADGKPLATQHGGPVRMVVPGKYFYKSVKWIETIDVLAEDRLGFWESDSGYHNAADPWLEQRFVAAGISKQHAARLMANRDFAGEDLLSIDCSGHDLDGLNARGAVLRNANFRGASLVRADFESANLSGARLTGANLTGASFRGADVEGADFCGANLTDVDFTGASFFGASFCRVSEQDRTDAATFSPSTKVDVEALDALTWHQREFLVAALEAQRQAD